uniref:Putative phospholipase/carboxyhydrolase n=1 Tax=Panstrongylus megistus TaxID=65343 RepID=A0A069DPH8_9HEMI
MEKKKLKVLCLHGFRQNKDTFKQKLGFLRKMLKSYADFVFMDAPHTLTASSNDEVEEKSWWFTGENQTYISKIPSDIDEGFSDSVESVQRFVKDNGPFDGLLGFSQGAAFAGILAILLERKEFVADFKFVILVAGFKSLCKPHLNYYNLKVNLPSLHIIGDGDNVIVKERSEKLMTYFGNPVLIRHPGGHYVPGGKELKDQYINFFNRH